MNLHSVLIFLLAATTLASPALADSVVLRSGEVIQGKVAEFDEGGVTVWTASVSGVSTYYLHEVDHQTSIARGD